MKALVAVKHAVDYGVKARTKTDGSDMDTNSVKMSVNPFDEVVVEEVIHLKETGKVSEIIAISLGDKKCEETLCTALTMGADRTVHIETDKRSEPLTVAKLLKVLVDKENPQILLLGKQAIDDDVNQTVQMLSVLLNATQGMFASKIEPNADEALITYEIDGDEETLALKLLVIISADLRLNEPRFVKLPNIMQAEKKPSEKLSPEELGISIVPLIRMTEVAELRERQIGIRVGSVTELADKLRNGAKVI